MSACAIYTFVDCCCCLSNLRFFEDRISLENCVEQACNDRYQAALALVGASLSHPVTPLA